MEELFLELLNWSILLKEMRNMKRLSLRKDQTPPGPRQVEGAKKSTWKTTYERSPELTIKIIKTYKFSNGIIGFHWIQQLHLFQEVINT